MQNNYSKLAINHDSSQAGPVLKFIAFSILVLFFLYPALASAEEEKGLFNSREILVGSPYKVLPQLGKIMHAILRMEHSRTQIPQLRKASYTPKVRQWHALMAAYQTGEINEKLAVVNRFVNQVRYVPEQGADVWRTPYTFLAQGGDCEDFAIAKYASLRQMGVDIQKIRIVLLKNSLSGAHHAVLAVKSGGVEYILDNNYPGVMTDKQLSHYVPIASFNEKKLWIHVPQGAAGPDIRSVQSRLSNQAG